MEQVKQAIHYWCNDTEYRKYLGQGVGVAVLDSGIMLHPDFDRRIKMFYDCVNKKRIIYDDNGHGTHVAGILAGSGKISDGVYSGIAPQAELIAVKVLDEEGNGSIPNLIAGFRWVLKYMKQYHIRIVNISVGAKPDIKHSNESVLIHEVEKLWDAGLVVVASAGNYGPEAGTISSPGASKKIITVGASDDNIPVYMRGKELYNYSGCGPTKECVIKPEVVAPGYKLISCNASYVNRNQKPYMSKSGTSMSTPVVSGALALLLSKYPDMSNVEVKLRLRETSERINGLPGQGWGRIHIEQLLK